MVQPSSIEPGFKALLAHPRSTTFRLRGAASTLDRGALAAAVSSLASALREQVGGDGKATAIVLAPRSRSSTVVALFALWEAGFTPLLVDHRVPPARYRAILETLDPAVVLSWEGSGTSRTLGILGDSWQMETRSGTDRLEGCPDPAYVAATSGSTGTPLLPLCRWNGALIVAEQWAQVAELSPDSRVLQFASPAYDAFYTEVIPTVLAGASLVCLDDDSWVSPSRLTERIEAKGVTHLTVPPSFAARLFATGRMPSLAFLGLAGEALDNDTAATALMYAARVVNAYGPTEATVCVSTQVVEDVSGEISLGAPWPHVNASVSEGEIVLGGPTVAWTYLGAPPEVTRFRADPATGEQTFRTGDLGEIRDGRLYFRGRKDDQLKLRGHRSGLKSIEWSVRRLAGVTDCAVVAWQGRPACLVIADRPLSDLSADLRGQLPVAEWPAAWLLVDAIPYLGSDKVDLRAVADLLEAQVTPGNDAVEPAWLADAWRRFATLAGADDDFFNAGGDSLRAMELLDAIYQEVAVDLDIGDFLSSPTFGWLRDAIARENIS